MFIENNTIKIKTSIQKDATTIHINIKNRDIIRVTPFLSRDVIKLNGVPRIEALPDIKDKLHFDMIELMFGIYVKEFNLIKDIDIQSLENIDAKTLKELEIKRDDNIQAIPLSFR